MHIKKLKRYLETLDEDDDLEKLVSRFFEENPDIQGAKLSTTGNHVYRWRVMEST